MNKNWRLSDDEYEFIKGEVTYIFEKYKIKCIPVSGFEIAAKMKITLVAYSGLSSKKLQTALQISPDGYFVEYYGKEYIYYNDIDKSYKRQNWTILHEIGHIVLDHTGTTEQEENKANFFAKYAIAPPILVHKIEATCTYDVYNSFDISFKAAEYAYAYYLSCKLRYERTKKLTKYEKILLSLCNKSA